MIWLICILWLGSSIPYWESIFHVYEPLSSWIDDCSPIRETTPCFDHEFRRSVTKLQTPTNEFRTRAPTLVWPHYDANREPNWYSPTFPNSTCGSPVFLAPWGHRELPLTPLTSVIASERMKITNAHSQRRNHSQRSMWPKYIYNFYIDLHRFTMIYQPSSISAQ